MNLYLFDIPDDPGLLPKWLEGHLMGLHLRQLVAELSVLGKRESNFKAALGDVLSAERGKVLQAGLGSLGPVQLRQLIGQPELLLDLQRLVLDEGGDYWATVPVSAGLKDNSSQTLKYIKESLGAENKATVLWRAKSVLKDPWAWAGAGWLSAAAAVLFAVLVQGTQVHQLENRVTQQAALTDSLRKELNDQHALARSRAQPADLPEFVVYTDPPDLPPDDPPDLPDDL